VGRIARCRGSLEMVVGAAGVFEERSGVPGRWIRSIRAERIGFMLDDAHPALVLIGPMRWHDGWRRRRLIRIATPVMPIGSGPFAGGRIRPT